MEVFHVSFPTLFSPLAVKGHSLRSRTVITAHGASDGFRSPAGDPRPYIEYIRRRAAGGVGLIILQPHFPNPLAEQPPVILERYAQLAAAVKPEGVTLTVQLAHLGVFAKTEADPHQPPLWGFDNSASVAGEGAHKMTDDQIELMIGAYRRMASLAVAAGLDGVEVHGAHGYLIQQSLMPWWNSRSDKWGQDRTLFVRRILQAVREELGPERILGYRTTLDDFRSPEDGGQGAAGVYESLRTILATGDVDLLNTTVGDGGKSYARSIPDFRNDEGTNIPFLRKLRAAVPIEIPVVGVGRIVSPSSAEAILESGVCDLVAMTRAHIADPDILLKARSGAGDRIRPCLGANYCVNRKLAGYPEISCVHNPEVLRELELQVTPATNRKKVVVVGAGPAGLKAAEVAARRGHEVILYDSRTHAGGRFRAVEHTAGAALAASLDYLVSELGHTSAQLRLGVTVDGKTLAADSPDLVILATGTHAHPAEYFPGGDTTQIVSSDEALTVDTSDAVLVYDTVGTNEAALVAETLALRGKRVVFATSFDSVVPNAGQLHRWVTPDVLRRRVSATHTSAIIGDIDKEQVSLVYDDGAPIADLEVGTIVTVVPRVSNTDLISAVQSAGIAHVVIGDAQAPRTVWHAFKEGEESALAI